MISHRALQLCYLKLSPSNTKADPMSHRFMRKKWGRVELWGPGTDTSRKPGVTGARSAELGCDMGIMAGRPAGFIWEQWSHSNGLCVRFVDGETQHVVLCKVCT